MKKGKKKGLRHQPGARRNYKDTLFRMLFRDKKRLLTLFNAVNGSSCCNPEDLEIVTLENAIYMNLKNDLAFIIDFQLNLYEHQSSYNTNMPLRFLFYVAREYQKLVKDKSLYAAGGIKIPTPHFVVFYNGERKAAERTVLKLSDVYQLPGDSPELELKVTMLNINTGCNLELMEACQTLKEYMQYVERVRRYTKNMPLEQAVEQAVDECIREGILSEFLSTWKAEAIAVSIFEYDAEREWELLRKTEREFIREEVKEEIREEVKEEVKEETKKIVQKQAIDSIIRVCRKLDLTESAIIEVLQADFSISKSKALEYIEAGNDLAKAR